MDQLINYLLVGISGLIGIVIGTYLTHFLNLKYIKEKIFFEKRLNYAEKIRENILINLDCYNSLICNLKQISYKNKESIEGQFIQSRILKKDAYIHAPQLYFDKLGKFSLEMLDFLKLEENLIEDIHKLKECKNEKEYRDYVERLMRLFENLYEKGMKVIDELKLATIRN